jgi:hypothetical protein
MLNSYFCGCSLNREIGSSGITHKKCCTPSHLITILASIFRLHNPFYVLLNQYRFENRAYLIIPMIIPLVAFGAVVGDFPMQPVRLFEEGGDIVWDVSGEATGALTSVPK